MVGNCAMLPAAETRTSPQVGAMADHQCHPLCDTHGMPMAHVAQGPAAVADRLWLLLALDEERTLDRNQCGVGASGAPATRPQVATERRHHRQSECQDLGRR